MAEYIERTEAIMAVTRAKLPDKTADGVPVANGKRSVTDCIRRIKEIPAADVEPVRHGKWQITDAYPHNVYCSECHTKCAQTHWAVWEDGSLPRNYCPNCGAKMEVES